MPRRSLAIAVFAIAMGWAPDLGGQTIPAGETISVKLERSISTKSDAAGESVTARLPRALKDRGEIVIPAGSTLHGRLDFVQPRSVREDGWLRLVFSRIELPDGRSVRTLASASFHRSPARNIRDRITTIGGIGAIGAFLGGKAKRVSAGLGGIIVGVLLYENTQRFGRDLTLPGGTTIALRLVDDLSGPERKAP